MTKKQKRFIIETIQELAVGVAGAIIGYIFIYLLIAYLTIFA